ncbi:MAG: hypothetical protein KKA42_14845, partial [candidate division Zixibacteria bacterium]|nr:hypothetical protein [candidate division Zixibacteria bacterium]
FFIDLSQISKADFGFMSMEEDAERKNHWVTLSEDGQWRRRVFKGVDIESGLPGIYFANVIGKDYVDWLGRDKFRTLPCHTQRDLDDGSIFVQTAGDLDYYLQPDGSAKDRAIIQHLGKDAFFDILQPERKARVPDFAVRAKE